MIRSTHAFSLALATIMVSLSPSSYTEAQSCALNADKLNLVPLNEMGGGTYEPVQKENVTYQGGLYLNTSNAPPELYADKLQQVSQSMEPIAEGNDPGKIALLSIGMSNTTAEYEQFMSLAAGNDEIASHVVIVNGAEGGQVLDTWDSASDPNWTTLIPQRLNDAGVSAAQVQALWLKAATGHPANKSDAIAIQAADLKSVIEIAADKFPNLKLVFLTSRTHAFTEGGSGAQDLQPEPYAYEHGFAVREVITDHINEVEGLNANDSLPLALWGPYIWAEGERADGFTWNIEDVKGNDCTHPSATSGAPKIGQALLDFFLSDPAAAPWFRADGGPGTPWTEGPGQQNNDEANNPGSGNNSSNDGGTSNNSSNESGSDNGGCSVTPKNNATLPLILLCLWLIAFRRTAACGDW